MKIKLLVILVIFSTFSLKAQNSFQRVYGDTTVFHSEDMQATTDSGFVVCGTTYLNTSEILLLKTDKYGSPLWSKKYGIDTIPIRPYSTIQTTDGGFITSGAVGDYNKKNRVFLLKVDPAGIYSWSKVYQAIDDTLSSISYSILQTSDAGFVICGNIYHEVFSIRDYLKGFLIKTDGMGNILWTKTYNRPISTSSFSEIQQTSDNGFIIKGKDGSNNGILLLKLSNAGIPIWSRTIVPSVSDSIFLIGDEHNYLVTTQNTGYALSGLFQKSNGLSGFSYPYVIKTDTNGVLIWNKTYSAIISDEYGGPSIKNTNDNGLILSGEIEDSLDNDNIYLMKTDNLGNIEWNRTWGNMTDHDMVGYFATQTLDNGFAVLGQNLDYTIGNTYLIKTDSIGNSQCGQINFPLSVATKIFLDSLITIQVDSNIFVDTAFTFITATAIIDTINACNPTAIQDIDYPKNNLILFPNPFSFEATLKTDINLRNVTLTIYNTFGQVIKIIKNISGQEIKLSRDDLQIGIYFIRLTQDNKIIATDKFVITD
jgi:hypothetical protein